MSRSQGRIQVPDDLREVLLEFTISYLLEQPGDVVAYAADYFSRLRDTRTTALVYDGAGAQAQGHLQQPLLSSPEDESTLSREEGARTPTSGRSSASSVRGSRGSGHGEGGQNRHKSASKTSSMASSLPSKAESEECSELATPYE